MRDLVQSGGIHLLSNVMIDFDVCKIPSQLQEEAKVKSELNAAGFKNYVTPKQAMIGRTHAARIRFWLTNLPNAAEFVELTPAQKIMRRLPFPVRRFVQKNIRKPQKKT